jgi:lipopolysaccharide biosynthesis protein
MHTHFIGHVFDPDCLFLLENRKVEINQMRNIYFSFPQTRKSLGRSLQKLFPSALVTSIPNKGRDMFPFRQVVRNLDLEPSDLIIKWHDKKRNHFSDKPLSDLERQNLLDLCIPLGNSHASVLAGVLMNHLDSNLVTLDGWALPLALRLGSNSEKLYSFCLQENWDWESIIKFGVFPAGGIFAIRAKNLIGTKWLDSDYSDIEFGHGGLDGTWAHASERWLGILAGRDGTIITISY